MSVPDAKVALITGCSSGIGYSTSLYLARKGYHVYSSVRSLTKAGPLIAEKERENLPLKVLKLDVTNEEDIVDSVSTILREIGRIDVLVNNAGFGLQGAVEEVSPEELRTQFETNFFGLANVTREVIPIMRRQRSGYVVNISSASGRIAIPFMGAYSATKFAIEGLSESLHHELLKFGVHVVIIEPGYVRTKFSENLRRAAKSREGNSPYAQMMKKSDVGHRRALSIGIGPEKVAKAIFQAISSDKPRLHYTVGSDAWTGITFRKLLPDRVFLWGVRRYYGLDRTWTASS